MNLEYYYNARTDADLRNELEWAGYQLRWNDQDRLDVYETHGGHCYTTPYRETLIDVFDSVYDAHRALYHQ